MSERGGVQRTYLFFCDGFKSNQKASVENMNKQTRKFFLKGKSIDGFTIEEIKAINKSIITTPLFSLDGATPKDAFITLFGLETFESLID